MITVTIPIGPDPVYRDYIEECVASVHEQERPPTEILIIDDQAHLTDEEITHLSALGDVPIRVWRTPWLSGVAHAFNFGVALSTDNLVLMLGSDDRLEPWAVRDCLAAWEATSDPFGYYYMDVRYSDGRQQNLPCHAAMVPKTLWRHNGGLPVESAVGAPDTILISIIMAAQGAAGNLRHVKSPMPPYFYRLHDRTDTVARSRPFYGAIGAIRDTLTQGAVTWTKPDWLR